MWPEEFQNQTWAVIVQGVGQNVTLRPENNDSITYKAVRHTDRCYWGLRAEWAYVAMGSAWQSQEEGAGHSML